MGRAWIGKQMTRGAWYYSAEEDVGYVGALRTHATILTVDPIFGEFAYGGVVTRSGRAASVVPRDGLRVRFHVIRADQRLHMELDHDGYAKERPIVVSDDLSRVQFTVENRTVGAHQTGLTIAGLPAGQYTVAVDGRSVATIAGGPDTHKVALPIARRRDDERHDRQNRCRRRASARPASTGARLNGCHPGQARSDGHDSLGPQSRDLSFRHLRHTLGFGPDANLSVAPGLRRRPAPLVNQTAGRLVYLVAQAAMAAASETLQKGA